MLRLLAYGHSRDDGVGLGKKLTGKIYKRILTECNGTSPVPGVGHGLVVVAFGRNTED